MLGLRKKKVDKAAWAEAVYGQKLKNPERESEEQLSALTTGLLMQHHRIIIDSVRIQQRMLKPDKDVWNFVSATTGTCLN